MKKETTKELRELIFWAKAESLEWHKFLRECRERLKNKGKKTGKIAK